MSQILRQNISGFPSACPPQVDDATMRLPRPFYYSCVLPLLVAGFNRAGAQPAPPGGPAAVREQGEARSFRIAAADASDALAAFARQSGAPLVYVVEHVRGIRTNALEGRLPARAALERLLARTPLTIIEDSRTGALMIKRVPSPAPAPRDKTDSNPDSQDHRPPAPPPVNTPRTNRLTSLFPALLSALSAPLAGAQTAPAGPNPARDEPITLAAFEVSTDRDVGYTAASALAGGRIDAPLKETPSAISIMTREFLDDIAATSFSSAAEWATNALPVGDTAGGAGGEHNVNIRGLGSSFPSRNYFRWYVSSDSYNTERLEFARGPNSILFGDANPGGVNTTWSKQALFVARRSVQIRADSWGGYRVSFDINQPAGDRLAVRFNVLHDHLGGWRDYDDAQRDGRHLAATWRIAKDTQFRAEYEQGRYLRYAFAQTFVDQSSNWNRTASYNGVTAPPTAGTGLARLNGVVTNDYLVWDPNVGQVVNWRGFFQSTGTGLTLLPEGRNIPQFPTLPSREYSLQPPDAFVAAKYKTWTFYLEQRLPAGLIAQLAFNHQQQTRIGNVRTWNVHRLDVNTVLPNGQPNPNYGKAFTDVNTNLLERPNELGDWRLSLAHRGDWRWLRHSLSLVAGHRTDQYRPRDYRVGRVNGPIPNAMNATNVLMVRQYWDAPRNPGMFDALVSNGGDYRWVQNSSDYEKQKLQYNQIASASSLFNGKLAILLGYRYDFYDRKAQGDAGTNPDGTPIPGTARGPGTFDVTELSLDTISAGAVWFPVPWVGPYVNYSEGFNAPGAGQSKLDGTTLLTSTTEGVDVGLKLEFFGGKLSGSIGYYMTEQVGRPRTGDNLADINQIWTDLGKVERTLSGYRDTESYKGHGVELDLTANLTRNWRLMFNYALPKTEQAEIGAGLRGYYEANLAEWRAGAGNPALPNAALIAQNILDIERTLQGYTEGRTLNGTVKYTGNLYTTYSFRDGTLKGFALGGGANFRGRQLIANANGRPFDYLYADAYTVVSAHVSYSHRLGQARARFQLNVSNLLNDRDVVFTGYSYNAALRQDFPNGFRHQAPRRFMLTATFDL